MRSALRRPGPWMRTVRAWALVFLAGCGEAPKPTVTPLELPEAAAVWRGAIPEGPRADVTIAADGTVFFGGVTFPRDPDGRQWSTFRSALAQFNAGDRHRNPDGSSRIPTVMRADGGVPWGQVHGVMNTCAHRSIQAYRLFFTVRHARDGSEGLLPWILPRDIGCGDHSLPALRFRLFRRGRTKPSAYTFIRLDRTHEFRLTSDEPQRTNVLASMHAAIRETLRALGERRADVAAEILTHPPKGPHVPYRDVVAVLGLLLSENVYPDLAATQVEDELGFRADGSRVEDDDPDDALPFEVPGRISIELPVSTRPPPNPSAPVLQGLQWLATHQSSDGGWEAAFDTGVTGLALSAFMSAGYTNRGAHPFKKTLSKGFRRLKNVQDPEGCFDERSGPRYIYNHAAAALAMVEIYGLTRSPIYKGSAQRAIGFIERARNLGGVWRYGLRPGDNDTSVTGWMTLPLLHARAINDDARRREKLPPLEVADAPFEAVSTWLEQVTDPSTARVGYTTRSSGLSRTPAQMERWPRSRSEALTALGLLMRLQLGAAPDDAMVSKMAALIRAHRPRWSDAASIDLAYWRFAAEALHRLGDGASAAWLETLEATLLEGQRRDGATGDVKGSWDPLGPWGAEGGRVYTTAMALLCLTAKTRLEHPFAR